MPDALEQIAKAVLYEGYLLWPFRRSARKNQQRSTFGGVYPPGFVAATGAGDRWYVQTQVLVVGESPRVEAELRFLELNGRAEIHQESIAHRVWRVTASLENTSDRRGTDRIVAQRHGFMSAHFVLRAWDGVFLSMSDPPQHVAVEVAACQNEGLWPVLVGDERTMLASPIILYDFPRVAPESPGLLFDSSEVDQLLYLNTLSLTDAEKAEVRATDPRAHQLLERAESMSSVELSQLNGALRDLRLLANALLALEDLADSHAVLVDATPRGGAPGTLYLIEASVDDEVPRLEMHGMDPATTGET
jgi:hypothetical protein